MAARYRHILSDGEGHLHHYEAAAKAPNRGGGGRMPSHVCIFLTSRLAEQSKEARGGPGHGRAGIGSPWGDRTWQKDSEKTEVGAHNTPECWDNF